jgi:DNA modification methylase
MVDRTTNISVKNFYSYVTPRKEWSFSYLSRAQTSEISHSYHQYPTKFIPQLARTLIEEYTNKNDVVLDPFCGSGTLNLEAFRANRKSIGTDINPVAVMISRVKTKPLHPGILSTYCRRLLDSIKCTPRRDIEFYVEEEVMNGNINILKKWFSPESMLSLSHILWLIKKSRNSEYQDFVLCAFSSILKRSSYWLTSSIKSQIDPYKRPKSPHYYFEDQINRMEKINAQFYNESQNNQTEVKILMHDAKKNLDLDESKIDKIITSPPYVVSYDYSDIFRLSTYFLYYHRFDGHEDYQGFRKRFIGTPLRKPDALNETKDLPGANIIGSIGDTGVKRNLYQYYRDMKIFFQNARQRVKEKGQLIMVVGDTELRKVKIPNTYLLSKIAQDIGWSLADVFEREVPAKILPTTREPKTGKFSTRKNRNYSEIYKKEYILVFRR